MAKGQLQSLLEFLHYRLAPTAVCPPSDSALLEQFRTQGDAAAFQALMQRHGPMVLAACQRILRNAHEAEDAFQATFLVLVRKAPTNLKTGSLGNWLYQVACHAALNARVRAARQSEREREVADMARAEHDGNPPNVELAQVLDEELRHLPEKYRAPLVLCYLQGKTHEEAARELSCRPGSMSRRMARAHELLRGRLERRGLTLSCAALAVTLASQAQGAVVPTPLLEATMQTAVLFAHAKGPAAAVATAKVATLVDDVLHTMALAKLKTAAAVLVSLGLVSVGAATIWHAARPGPPVLTLSEAGADPDWGAPIEGVRLRCSSDRDIYRLGQDLVHVAFAVRNVSPENAYVNLRGRDDEFTDLHLVGPDGRERIVKRHDSSRPFRFDGWSAYLPPGGIERVGMMVDPATVDGGLPAGSYRMHGVFHRRLADGRWFRLRSNETTITLLPPPQTGTVPPTGPEVGGLSVALGALAERSLWKPGDPPLSFAVVLHRLADELPALRFAQRNNLGMYYHLEVSGADGKALGWCLQPAESAGVVPGADRFAHTRLLFFQLDRVPVGKSVGERIEWDPANTARRSGYVREPVVSFLPMLGAGQYTVRAVYSVGLRDRGRFAGEQPGLRLVSNPVLVSIGR